MMAFVVYGTSLFAPLNTCCFAIVLRFAIQLIFDKMDADGNAYTGPRMDCLDAYFSGVTYLLDVCPD